MSLTNTSNSALSRELAFDTSYVSRIRNGKRGVPRHQPFVEPAAAFLANRIREPYQVRIVEEELGLIEGWPQSSEEKAKVIASWLGGTADTLDKQFEKLFGSLETSPTLGQDAQPHLTPHIDQAPLLARTFYDDEGKRAAIEVLFAELIEAGEPYELYVYSDESMDWLFGDDVFARRWMSLVVRFLENGGTITVVHTVTRTIGEMLEAVQKWLPLYLTGNVESYYYPHVRRGAFRHMLIVAPGKLALSSSSIGSVTEGMATMLFDERAAVDAHAREMFNLLALCQPLVSVSPIDDREQVGAILKSLHADGEPIIFAHNGDARALPSVLGAHIEYLSRIAEIRPQDTDRLPAHVVALVSGTSGFALIHLDDPLIIMHVSESLLTDAFKVYLEQSPALECSDAGEAKALAS